VTCASRMLARVLLCSSSDVICLSAPSSALSSTRNTGNFLGLE
jgi:hypothetical protein